MTFSFTSAWCWGVFYSRTARAFYLFPLPGVGLVITLAPRRGKLRAVKS